MCGHISLVATLLIPHLLVAQEPKLDAYGDPLPAGAIARLGTVRWRHGQGTIFVSFLPDGKRLLTIGNDATVRQWDVATGKELRQFRLAGEIVGRSDLEWAIDNRTRRIFFDPRIHFALSPDGKTLVVTGTNSWMKLFDVDKGEETRKVGAPFEHIAVIVFSPDSRTLASLSEDGTIRLLDIATGDAVGKFGNTEEQTNRYLGGSLVFSPDGKTVICGRQPTAADPQAVLELWQVATGKESCRILDPTRKHGMTAPVFFPDGKSLLWIRGDGSLLQADALTGQEIRRVPRNQHGNHLGGFLFTPDGKKIANFDESGSNIVIWEVADGKGLLYIRPNYWGAWHHLSNLISFSPDSKLFAVGGTQSPISLFDVEARKRVKDYGPTSPVTRVGFARDGKTVLSVCGSTCLSWDAATGKEVSRNYVLRGDDTLSDDCSCLAENARGLISLRDPVTGKELHTLPGKSSFFRALAISSDHNLVATLDIPIGQRDEESTAAIVIHDLGTKRERYRLVPPVPASVAKGDRIPHYLLQPRSLTFSPDGQVLAVFWENTDVVMWDMATGREFPRLEGQRFTPIRAFAFSHDGRSVAIDSADEAPHIWEVATGHLRRLFKKKLTIDGAVGTEARTNSAQRIQSIGTRAVLAISHGNRLLAHSRGESTIDVWDITGGRLLAQLKGHQAEVTSLKFAPEGKTLASGSLDTTILIWDMSKFTSSRDSDIRIPNVLKNWNELRHNDASRAFDAICSLASAPAETTSFLKAHLPAPPVPEAEEIERFVADLDNELFEVRKKAHAELERIGLPGAPALRKALELDPSPEMKKSIHAARKNQRNSTARRNAPFPPRHRSPGDDRHARSKRSAERARKRHTRRDGHTGSEGIVATDEALAKPSFSGRPRGDADAPTRRPEGDG
jgi:WD40 repeat protein